MANTRKVRWQRGALGWMTLALLSVTGCSLDGLLNTNQVPAGVTDPALTKSSKGAMAVYRGLLAKFRGGFGGQDAGSFANIGYVAESGLITDELRAAATTTGGAGTLPSQDLRSFGTVVYNPTSGLGTGFYPDTTVFVALQKIRAQAGQTIGLLNDYADPAQPALVGHSYALEGYAEVLLAELFCSGIPLSTLDYNGDFTTKAGSSTNDVFAHAAALFDTALALAGDSTRFQYLAMVGKGRALLGQGDYTAAAAAVQAVPDGYRYMVSYAAADSARNFASEISDFRFPGSGTGRLISVLDQEGANGLDYVTSQDPRTPMRTTTATLTGASVFRPATTMYATDGSSPIVLASAVEARLIEAEAALHGGDPGTWLTMFNALRTDGTYDLTAASPPDTLWHAGTGGVAGLKPLADPGTADGRVDLMFRERAFWLYLTGHRQGDLRRLIRQYGRNQSQVYPTGVYGGSFPNYGTDVNLPVPASEQVVNPQFTGCESRDA